VVECRVDDVEVLLGQYLSKSARFRSHLADVLDESFASPRQARYEASTPCTRTTYYILSGVFPGKHGQVSLANAEWMKAGGTQPWKAVSSVF